MKPIIYPITPFDVKVGTTISLKWSGEQQKSNTVKIYNNTSGALVYTHTQDSFKGTNIIPANATGMHNGETYYAIVSITTATGEVSEESSAVIFKCFTTPVWKFKDITNDYIVQNSNIEIYMTYSQSEDELINTWQVNLYDISKTLLLQGKTNLYSPILYDNISGLSDRVEYYLRGIGTTVNGIPLDTGYIHITVTYRQASLFSTLELNNIVDQGSIQIKANVVSIEGSYKVNGVDRDNSEVRYIDNDYADLRGGGSVTFDKGFQIEEDPFTLITKFYDVPENKVFMTMTDNGKGYEFIFRCLPNTDNTYHINSMMVEGNNDGVVPVIDILNDTIPVSYGQDIANLIASDPARLNMNQLYKGEYANVITGDIHLERSLYNLNVDVWGSNKMKLIDGNKYGTECYIPWDKHTKDVESIVGDSVTVQGNSVHITSEWDEFLDYVSRDVGCMYTKLYYQTWLIYIPEYSTESDGDALEAFLNCTWNMDYLSTDITPRTLHTTGLGSIVLDQNYSITSDNISDVSITYANFGSYQIEMHSVGTILEYSLWSNALTTVDSTDILAFKLERTDEGYLNLIFKNITKGE